MDTPNDATSTEETTNETTTAAQPRLGDPKKYPQSDLGNAERLIDQQGTRLRHGKGIGWAVYEGGMWHLQSDAKHAKHVAQQTIREARREIVLYSDEKEEVQARFYKFLLQSENNRAIEQTLKSAAASPRFDAQASSFNRHEHLLNFSNGMVDLQTGKLHPHDPSKLLTTMIREPEGKPRIFNPKAQCPRWLQFLMEICAENKELVNYIHRVVGYCLTGSISEKQIFFFSGKGDNGKSALTGTICTVLGEDYAKRAMPGLLKRKSLEAHPTEVAALLGRRLVAISDDANGARLNEGRIKELTGDKSIETRIISGNPFTMPVTFKFWMADNYRPNIQGLDDAIWSRMPLIPLEVKFKNPDEPHLPGELVKDFRLLEKLEREADGILAWGVRGAVAWYAEGGLKQPDVVRKASQGFRDECDWLAQFFADRCRVEEGARAFSTPLYVAYREWCREIGVDLPIGRIRFGELVGDRFPRATSNGTYYTGLRLLTPSETVVRQ